jgi:hypothetical protein
MKGEDHCDPIATPSVRMGRGFGPSFLFHHREPSRGKHDDWVAAIAIALYVREFSHLPFYEPQTIVRTKAYGAWQ